jgi:hypothetical protein
MTVQKNTGLAKSSAAVRNLAARLEKARQTRNERVARADADYVEAVRRALADVEPVPATTVDAPSDGQSASPLESASA